MVNKGADKVGNMVAGMVVDKMFDMMVDKVVLRSGGSGVGGLGSDGSRRTA